MDEIMKEMGKLKTSRTVTEISGERGLVSPPSSTTSSSSAPSTLTPVTGAVLQMIESPSPLVPNIAGEKRGSIASTESSSTQGRVASRPVRQRVQKTL